MTDGSGCPGRGSAEVAGIHLGYDVFNTTHQVCAVLSAYTEDDSPRVRLSASTTDADPLWVELSHDQDDIDCSLPTLMRKDSIP